jgi:hypothetical protein
MTTVLDASIGVPSPRPLRARRIWPDGRSGRVRLATAWGLCFGLGCATSGTDVLGRTPCERLRVQCQQNQDAADFFGGDVQKREAENARACWERYERECRGQSKEETPQDAV